MEWGWSCTSGVITQKKGLTIWWVICVGFISCYLLSFQVETLELFPEEHVHNQWIASKKANTRKHGSLWEFYRYYKDKKGFGGRDEGEGPDLSLVENFNILDNDIDLEINKEIE